MTRFIQLHLLTSYPPANLNRDDTGNPKTARVGGVERLRVSSQSLKRAWRTSEVFQQQLSGNIGTRTKRRSLDTLVATLALEKRAPTTEELDALLHVQHAVDIAMFGRMLASKTRFNAEAAVQVAHAFGVHASVVEDDYFTAVDDLNNDDSGAGHVGEAGFAAAVFYQYVCIDRDQLKKNLGGDEDLTKTALAALTQAALTVGPSGKQNSFASRARAHYALAEKGEQQPRSLSLAFVKPVIAGNYAEDAIEALKTVKKNMDSVYGPCADEHYEIDVLAAEGKASELISFVAA
jgi:CRISPR system Cascade subunit CasC